MDVKRINRELILKIILVAFLCGFVAYGLSLVFSTPTVETITTGSTRSRKSNLNTTDVDYKR